MRNRVKLLFALQVIGVNASKHDFLNLQSSSINNAEEARWLVQSGHWGTLSTATSDKRVNAEIVSFGETEGRLFFYLMGETSSDSSLTLSEASLYPEQFEGARCGNDADTDPEDPRCAKLTITGKVSPCADDESCKIGKKALFTDHPAMANWPGGHGFIVHEIDITDLWMIANYGGGGAVDVSTYHTSTPVHHAAKGFPNKDSSKVVGLETLKSNDSAIPDAQDAAARARWLVSNSLWTTISTSSVHLGGKPWGNIRSVVDGKSLEVSKGLPYFYLPSPDPTMIDIKADNRITLTFSEAALAERVDGDGKACGGQIAEDPTCARIHISGTARPLDDTEISVAKETFGERHPRASWLSGGGAHTGGGYFTIDIESIAFLDFYGGFTPLSVADYLAWFPTASLVSSSEGVISYLSSE